MEAIANKITRGSGRAWSLLPVVALLLATAIGCAVFSPLVMAKSTEPASYRLDVGDKIAVSVLGQKELTGPVTVDTAGNIRLLLVGELAVKGLTIAEVEKRIVARLADGFLKEPQVSVSVSELRPVYILGKVRRAGSYPFRHGSTIKSLLAVAGGLGLPERERTTTVSEFLAAEGRLRELRQSQKSLTIRLARLEAQRDGKETFEVPASATASAASDVADVVAWEKEALQKEQADLKSQLAMLHSQQPRLQAQIEALKGQIATATKQIQIAQEQIDRYEKLSRRGLARNSTRIQLIQTQANYETERWRGKAELSRLEFNAGEIDLKIQEAELVYKRKIASELETVRRRLKELEVAIPTAIDVRDSRLNQSGGAAVNDDSYSYRVTRITGNVANTFAGSETTVLQPGDIVDVKVILDGDSGSQSAGLGGQARR